MKVIGLCGGSGSGKGTVARLFRKYDIVSLDTDKIYHELTSQKSECLDSLVAEFGVGILNAEGALDRRALAAMVFSSDGAKIKQERLNKIAHFYVLAEVRKRISELQRTGVRAVMVDAPLLFESGFDSECERIIAVTAEKGVRIARIVERDGISKEAAAARNSAQLPDEYIVERSDYNIVNDGDIAELERRVEAVAHEILK